MLKTTVSHIDKAHFIAQINLKSHILSKMTPTDFNFLSDSQIEAELGKRLKRRRVDLRLNQTELAERAGVGRRTITAVENGQGCSLGTLISLLRALDGLNDLGLLLPIPEISPIAETSTRMKERIYPYKARKKKDAPNEWKWNDEK